MKRNLLKKPMAILMTLAMVLSLMSAMTIFAQAGTAYPFSNLGAIVDKYYSVGNYFSVGSENGSVEVTAYNGATSHTETAFYPIDAAASASSSVPYTIYIKANGTSCKTFTFTDMGLSSCPAPSYTWTFESFVITFYDAYGNPIGSPDSFSNTGEISQTSVSLLSSITSHVWNVPGVAKIKIDYVIDYNGSAAGAGNLQFENITVDDISDTLSAPTVTTQAVSSITAKTATGNGNVTALGSPKPTAYGVCWNTTGTPTISDSKVTNGAKSSTGAFTAAITGLATGTKYYVRAYATNTIGTVYGEEVSFTTAVADTGTVLTAGDLVILEFNGNGTDGFTFMPLVDLETGTIINFTDYGWNATSGAFHIAEEGNTTGGGNMITYTAPSKITAGTLIRQNTGDIGGNAFTVDAEFSAYNFNNNNYISILNSLNTGHDGILAFQGSITNPTFIWGYYTGQWGKGSNADYYWSDLPSGLTNGTNAVYFADFSSGDVTVDDGYYSGVTTAATAAVWRTRVADSTNWTTLASGTAPALLYPNTYMVSSPNTAPTVNSVTPATVSYEDTAASDTFTNTKGTITATDSDGTVSYYGISGQLGGSYTYDSVTYNEYKAGTYGTLYVKSSTGNYVFAPNSTAINAVSANQNETFTVTATDNLGATGNATLTVSITGANDAPTLAANTGITVAESSEDTVISKAKLEATDVDTAATSITYTLTALPTNGTLKNSGSALGVNATFTQADINNGQITYTHNGSETGSDSFTFTVSDGAGGNIGTTAFAVTVTTINDAPVLDSSGTMTLTSVTEDSTGETGNTVAAIIASAGGDRITDADSGALEGIAVTGLTGDGTWQYNTGSGWNAIGAVSGTSALLLRGFDSIRFVPTASYNNAQTATIAFRAWDQTSGAQGTKVDASTNGGTTAFSTATAMASIVVTAVNDNPALTGLPVAVTVHENTATDLNLSVATFSDPDSGANSITLTLSVDKGTLTAASSGGVTVTGSGTATLALAGTAANIDTYLNTNSNIKYTGPIGLFGNSAATLTLTANDGSNTGTGGGVDVSLGTVNINITAIAPTVTNVTSTKNNGTYGLGETIEITVEFSHAVVVTGTPQLTLETGAADRTANYSGGSGSKTLTFTYTTQPGDQASDLDYKATDSLILNGGTIIRGDSPAILTLLATAGTGSLGANKDLVIAAYPTVTLSVGSANIAENVGMSTITATLPAVSSQDVVVTLDYSGGTATSGTDYNATGSTTITIPAGSLSASAATGITAIQDTATEGNETIVISITGVTKGVEAVEQQVTITILDDDIAAVTSVSSSTADGSYKSGNIISIQVTFSAAVTVLGTPQMLLETGTYDSTINYVSGSGSTVLTFNYAVQTGDTSSDLNYLGTDSLTLNGGAITNSGQAASRVLPALGSVNSLAGNKAIVIDTTAPSVPIITTATQTINAGSITINGTAEAGATITITGGAATATGTAAGGNYSISVNLTQDAVNTLVVKAADAAGNNSTTANVLITEDSTAPSVPVISTLAQTVNAGSITINGTAEAGATITITGGTATATGTAAGGNYSISVNLTQDAVNTLVVKATDAAGNNSTTASVAITEDSVAPSIPVSTIAVSDLSSNSAKLTWTAATDNITTAANLQYKVIYSTSDITSVAAADALSGTWTSNIATATVTGLTASTDYYFNVLVKDEAGNKSLYTATTGKTTAAVSGGGGTTSGSAVVEVNGQRQDAGTADTQTTGGQTVTTIKVDDTKLDTILESSGEKPTVTLPSTGSDVTVGELNGQTVKNMETKEATLEIRTDSVTYTLPASQINIDSVSAQLGSQVALKDIKVSVSIAEPPADTVRIIEDTANKNSYQLVVKPVEFTITCTSGDKTVDVSQFNGYVERTVAIPDGVDPAKITTGIVLNADGTFRHVPTQIVIINGKYYAKINSLTNSTYSVIWNSVEFADVTDSWAKDAINDMGSRMIVTGVDGKNFEPNRDITRAEFAAIIVRALGLEAGMGVNKFTDVTSSNWYFGCIETAISYGLITGYGDGTFGPNDKITREQAMVIVARAMEITGLKTSLTESKINNLLAGFADSTDVSSYAESSIAACVDAGVVSGKTDTNVAPQDNITRAEVAAIVQRLLQKSHLI